MKIEVFVCNPFQENTYVVYDEQTLEAAVIDCGCYTSNEKEALCNFIDKHNLNIKYLLNTHLHLDHMFGNSFLANRYNILPLGHQADEVLLQHFDQQLLFFGLQSHEGAQPLGGYISNEDTLTLGNEEIHILHTPGHSPGGVCFYSKDSGVVFSGDVIFLNSIGRSDLHGGNQVDLVASITDKLFALPDETVVYPGHGPSTKIGFERQNNPYL